MTASADSWRCDVGIVGFCSAALMAGSIDRIPERADFIHFDFGWSDPLTWSSGPYRKKTLSRCQSEYLLLYPPTAGRFRLAGSKMPVSTPGSIWPLLAVFSPVSQGGGLRISPAAIDNLMPRPGTVEAFRAAGQTPDVEIVGWKESSRPQGQGQEDGKCRQ